MKRCFFLMIVFFIPFLAHKLLHDLGGGFQWRKIAPIKRGSFLSSGDFLPEGMVFHYLGMGHHVYAFLSEDKKYVLKFLRYHKFRSHFWTRLAFFPPAFRKKELQSREKRLSFLWESHRLAAQFLREETGLITYQEPGVGESRQVVLVDFWGRKKTVDLQKTGFALQQYFPLYGKEFPKWMQKQDSQAIQQGFCAYFEVIAARFAKGFVNKDRRGWGKNYGITPKGVAYEIDLGAFCRGATQDLAWEIEQCSRDFRHWVKRKTPKWKTLFEQELAKAKTKKALEHKKNREQKLN